MVKINKLHLALGAVITIIAFLGLYFFYDAIPKELGDSFLDDIDVNISETNAEINLIGAYWGESDLPATDNDTCSNETKNSIGFVFTMEAETTLIATSYEECFILNDGEKIPTTINELHDKYIDLQAIAETDKENEVQLCCLFGERLDCSETTPLLKCALE